LPVVQAKAYDSCLGTKRRAVIPYPVCVHGVVHVAGRVKFRPPYNVGGGELRIGRVRTGKNYRTPITILEGILAFLLECVKDFPLESARPAGSSIHVHPVRFSAGQHSPVRSEGEILAMGVDPRYVAYPRGYSNEFSCTGLRTDQQVGFFHEPGSAQLFVPFLVVPVRR